MVPRLLGSSLPFLCVLEPFVAGCSRAETGVGREGGAGASLPGVLGGAAGREDGFFVVGAVDGEGQGAGGGGEGEAVVVGHACETASWRSTSPREQTSRKL